jgi:hypothetical protein
MQLPIIDFRGQRIVNPDGTFSDVGQSFFDSLLLFLIKTIGDEGVVLPPQSTANANIIAGNTNSQGAYTCQFGTGIYNPDTNTVEFALNNGRGIPVFQSLLQVGVTFTEQVLFASAIPLTTATLTDITSVLLTPGSWEIIGNFLITGSGANVTIAQGWVNTTSATAPDASLVNGYDGTVITSFGTNTATIQLTVDMDTTIYLSCTATFGSGSASACGQIICTPLP